MSRFYANLPNLVIAITESVSGTITASLTDAVAVAIAAPASLTGTVTVQGSLDAGTTFQDIEADNADAALTIGAGNVVHISPFPYDGLSLSSSTTEAAARTFLVSKSFDVR